MDMFEDLLVSYLERTCDQETALLRQIDRETHLKETMPHMLSGHYQGRLLSFLSKLTAPNKIVEIGTFTGYATICLAEGLAKDGVIHTIDINEELEDRVLGYFNESAYCSQIQYHIGDAREIIPELDGPFDLIFIDADKRNNLHYYELVLAKSRPGALIIIDNVLWKGKVIQGNTDSQTQQISELNETLSQDSRVDKLILPVRDGLFLLRKR